MSVEVDCTKCGAEYDARHGECPACKYEREHSVPQPNSVSASLLCIKCEHRNGWLENGICQKLVRIRAGQVKCGCHCEFAPVPDSVNTFVTHAVPEPAAALCSICLASGRVYCPPEHTAAAVTSIVSNWASGDSDAIDDLDALCHIAQILGIEVEAREDSE